MEVGLGDLLALELDAELLLHEKHDLQGEHGVDVLALQQLGVIVQPRILFLLDKKLKDPFLGVHNSLLAPGGQPAARVSSRAWAVVSPVTSIRFI